MKHEEIRTAVDKLIVEKGKKIDRHYRVEFTIKDLLEKLELKNTEDNQRYARYVIQTGYEKAVFVPGQGDNGGFVRLKVRSA